MLKNIFINNILMASQETMDFVKNIIEEHSKQMGVFAT